MILNDFIQICHSRLNQFVEAYFNNHPVFAPSLQKAMTYAVLNGGKRVRPLLVYATGYSLNASWENLDVPACAIELIHTYSLIHDDLPAMDNSDLRRGKPSCHKKFGEALAILAGDALQPLAFEILSKHPTTLTTEQRLNMITLLSEASGHQGMVAGQTLDMAGTDSIQSLTSMYRLKTGALLSASVKLGALTSSHHSPEILNCLGNYAENIGLAFQIQDDLLDIERSEETGKPQGIDVINKKLTYPNLFGIKKTREKIEDLFAEAFRAIESLGEKGLILCELADYLLQRNS